MHIDFELAKDKVLMGAERKSMVMSNEEKKNTAYHEAGHALVAALMPFADPVHKVTIIPRGMALGVTMQLPIDDKHSYNKQYLDTQLAILMAGRIAEELFMGHITTGAGNDIERATDMARKMVCEGGMSELGPISLGQKEEQIFLGREIAQHRDYSEATAIRIDEQVKKLVQDGYNRSKEVIEAHRDELIMMAELLLEREVLDGAEVLQIVQGKTLPAMPAKNKPNKPDDGQTQQVLRPEGGGRRLPGLNEGERPQPA
jgi:cell division protease FtsH